MRLLAIPVKSLDRCKRRLAPVLTPMERAALSLAMLEDVLDAALAASTWNTVVVSPDEAVLEVAARRGAETLIEEHPPLSSAVRQVEQEALDRGADALAVLVADAALITPDALREALRTLGPVVLSPSSTDGGTTLLVRRPPRAIGARFGRGSLERHLHGASTRGLPTAVVDRHELTFDLDTPDDLARFLDAGKHGRTRSCLLEMDAPSRVGIGA